MAKIFDISTIEGLSKAEHYQYSLYSKFINVDVKKVGINKVKIEGS